MFSAEITVMLPVNEIIKSVEKFKPLSIFGGTLKEVKTWNEISIKSGFGFYYCLDLAVYFKILYRILK